MDEVEEKVYDLVRRGSGEEEDDNDDEDDEKDENSHKKSDKVTENIPLKPSSEFKDNRRVMILQGFKREQQEKLIHGEEEIALLSLNHPKYGVPFRFALFDNILCEIQSMEESPASWFIDDSVEKDGSLYIVTPIDPLFLMLNFLKRSRRKTLEHEGYFCELNQVLEGELEATSCAPQLYSLFEKANLSIICDQHSQNLSSYRLNDDKVLQWLQCKVEQLLETLENSPIDISISSAQSDSFRRSKESQEKKPSKVELLRSALGFLSEYVDETYMDMLAKLYEISSELEEQEKFVESSSNDSLSQHRKENSTVKVKASTPKKPRLTPGQQKLAKVNTKGMSKISSFFSTTSEKKGN